MTETLSNLWSLAGRVTLVTGGAAGIGRACATILAEAGADVMSEVFRVNTFAPDIVAKHFLPGLGRQSPNASAKRNAHYSSRLSPVSGD